MGCCDGGRAFDHCAKHLPEVRYCETMSPISFKQIKVDLREVEDKLIVEAELPGFDREDISLLLADTTLSISAEKKNHQEENDGYLHKESSSYAKYQRSIYLPFEVDDKQIKAYYNAGVLRVDIPKPSSEEVEKNIEIN